MLWPAGSARGKVKGSPKSLGHILWGPWMSVQSFMSIHPKVVGIFLSESRELTDWHHHPWHNPTSAVKNTTIPSSSSSLCLFNLVPICLNLLLPLLYSFKCSLFSFFIPSCFLIPIIFHLSVFSHFLTTSLPSFLCFFLSSPAPAP